MKDKKDPFLRKIHKKSEQILRERELFQRKVEKTESHKKLWNYVNTLVEDIGFQRKIARMRKKYGIPSGGIPINENEENRIQYANFLDVTDKNGKWVWNEFTKEVSDFSEKEYGLFPNWSSHTIREYILYNILEEPELGGQSLFRIVDLRSFLERREYTREELIELEPMTYEEKIASLTYLTKTYPVALIISPYAVEREIADYVKKLYKLTIKPIQEKYKNPKIKLGKTRKRSTAKKDRNKFIYDNRNIARKDLIDAVAKKFGDILDNTYINKIIKDETKKISVHR